MQSCCVLRMPLGQGRVRPLSACSGGSLLTAGSTSVAAPCGVRSSLHEPRLAGRACIQQLCVDSARVEAVAGGAGTPALRLLRRDQHHGQLGGGVRIVCAVAALLRARPPAENACCACSWTAQRHCWMASCYPHLCY